MESKGLNSQDMKILESQRLSNTNHQDTASTGGNLHSGITMSNLAWSLKPTLGTITLIPSIIKTGASSLEKSFLILSKRRSPEVLKTGAAYKP